MNVTQPQGQAAFYENIVPLQSKKHADYSIRSVESLAFAAGHHAIPVTTDEFVKVQRHFPIVFGKNESDGPMALMGMRPGSNAFIDETGNLDGAFYVPAFIRRYPFIGIKPSAEATALSLCFDQGSGMIGEFDDGKPLFGTDGEPTDALRQAIAFCEAYEQANTATTAFMKALREKDLLVEGRIEVVSGAGQDEPAVFQGFKVVEQARVRALDSDTLASWNEQGFLAPLFAHFASLEMFGALLEKQSARDTHGDGLRGRRDQELIH